MIIESQRTAAYICPICSELSIEQISLFRLYSGGVTELDCGHAQCKESCVYITRTGKKFKIEIECAMCGELHTFTVSADSLMNRGLTMLSCPMAGVPVFFFGTNEAVLRGIEENQAVLEELADPWEGMPEDIEIVFRIFELLSQLAQQKRISCKCGSDTVIPEIDEDAIILRCPDCGAQTVISPDEDSLEQLSKSQAIILDGGER